MPKNRLKWSKMVQKDQKWAKMGPKVPKWVKNGKNGQKWPKKAKNHPKMRFQKAVKNAGNLTQIQDQPHGEISALMLQ